MFNHLVAKVLPGKTEEEILELLGPPQYSDSDSSTNMKTLYYELGPDRGYPEDNGNDLQIWIAEDGYFERYQTFHDS